jgi:hypothetical protein
MVVFAIWLSPPGLFDRALARQLFQAVVAGAAMVVAARLLSGVTQFVAAPLSVVAYAACLWAIGGLGKDQLQMLRGIVQKRAAVS